MAQHHHDMPELMWQCRTSPSVLAADNFSLPLKIPTHLKFRDKPKESKICKRQHRSPCLLYSKWGSMGEIGASRGMS